MGESTNRRGFLAAVASLVAGAGCYQKRYRDGVGLRSGGGTSSSVDLSELSFLEIASGTVATVSSGVRQTCEGILWEPNSMLEIEPGGEIEFESVEA